jgi:AraC-like DNA-binding protein
VETISLINAGIISVSIQSCAVLWRKPGHRGICLYMLLIAIAAALNLVEGYYLTSDIFIITPVFQLLFGPALFLACSDLTNRKFSKLDSLHFLPALVSLLFTGYIQIIIALGTLSRIGYSVLTAHKLYSYKNSLDSERSDSDEYSFQWMIWVIAITALFNLFDLIRLNLQSYLNSEVNLMGQAFNNGLWLIVIIFITYKLNTQGRSPSITNTTIDTSSPKEGAEQYLAIYTAVDNQVKSEQLFRVERLTLSQLSNDLGLQQRDISRAINLNANKSFNGYVNGLRVDFVCNLLNSSAQQSITDLALQAGFSSKAVFNRSFKQQTGMTPSQYKISKDRQSNKFN